MQKSSRAFLVTMAITFIVGGWVILQAPREARSKKSYISCNSNLTTINLAKASWAEANQKNHGEQVDEVEILSIIGNGKPIRLICPDGGSYEFGRVGEPASCSSTRKQ